MRVKVCTDWTLLNRKKCSKRVLFWMIRSCGGSWGGDTRAGASMARGQ
jgi:hypothetical protein